MMQQQTITVQTQGRATVDITTEIEALLRSNDIEQGLCHVFIHHTSASLIITENADADVRRDLENYIAKLVKDGDPAYLHDQEGADDMAAHIRSVLTQTEITIPIHAGRLALGTWQGLYLWEHRYRPHRRRLTVTLTGT
ncbi:MAG: YjbQ family protein [Gammaproteobacteria bacterium]|nr:MAG: YjbQ family protein [Gammaproteobacteria bacterium]